MTPLRDSLYTVIRTTERISIQTLAEKFKAHEITIELHIKRLIEEGRNLKIKNGYVINKNYGVIEKLIQSSDLFRRARERRLNR
jgi:DeoR/GlpR family transcriptional regulator of sugar metabolism